MGVGTDWVGVGLGCEIIALLAAGVCCRLVGVGREGAGWV